MLAERIEKQINVFSDTRELAGARAWLASFLKQYKVPEEKARHIVIAVDEAMSAIIMYNIFKKYRHGIKLSVSIDSQEVGVRIDDPMTVFDSPNDNDDDEAFFAAVSDEKRFQMSLFLMRNLMDEVCYVFKAGSENYVELSKKIRP